VNTIVCHEQRPRALALLARRSAKALRRSTAILLSGGIFLLLAGCATTHARIVDDEGARVVKREKNATSMAEAITHYLAATIDKRNGRFEDAAVGLQAAAAALPDNAPLAIELVQAYLRTKDLAQALQACERAVVLSPDDASLWIVLGWLYRNQDLYENAEASFRKAISIDKQNPLGYEALAMIQEKTNDLVSAIDIYESMLAILPQSAALHYQLGLTLARINDTRGARAAVEQALALDPGLDQARFLLGVVCLDLGDNGLAIEQLARVVEANPFDIRARQNLAAAFARQGQHDKAIQQYDAILASPDASPKDTLARTYLLLRAGDYQQVMNITPPNAAPYMGQLLRALALKPSGGAYRDALESLDQIQGDLDAESKNFLSELTSLFGKTEVSGYFIEAFQAFRTEGVVSRIVDTLLARILITTKDYAQAETVLADALARHGKDKLLHLYAGMVYNDLDRFDETEAHLRACLAIDPSDAEVMNFLGYLYADKNRKLDEAHALLKRALEIDPVNGYFLDSMGWVFYRQGNADKAVEYIRKAILAMDSDDAELRNHLGDAYLLQGDLEKAIGEWRRARRLNPDLKGVQEKLDRHAIHAPSKRGELPGPPAP